MRIRITGIPPGGPAPEEVRKAWIGCILPVVAGHEHLHASPLSGDQSTPHTRRARFRAWLFPPPRAIGYVIDAATAVDILGRSAPAAASWWRSNAPHLLGLGCTLLFDELVCEVLPTDKPGSQRAVADKGLFG